MVRLRVIFGKVAQSVSANFNSSMVRLRAATPDLVQIDRNYFNSSVVRLRVDGEFQNFKSYRIFQFQCGAIEGRQ